MRSVFRDEEAKVVLSRWFDRFRDRLQVPTESRRVKTRFGDTHVLVGGPEQASARGELRPGVDAALFGAAYFSFFYFALISWVQGAHGAPVALVERLIGQHLEGLRPSSTAPRRKDR